MRSTNQQNPPLPKRKRVDAQGNDKRRVFIKSGTGTMAEAMFPSENAANAYIEQDRINIRNLGGTILYDSKFVSR